jgi:hypothetical protein
MYLLRKWINAIKVVDERAEQNEVYYQKMVALSNIDHTK